MVRWWYSSAKVTAYSARTHETPEKKDIGSSADTHAEYMARVALWTMLASGSEAARAHGKVKRAYHRTHTMKYMCMPMKSDNTHDTNANLMATTGLPSGFTSPINTVLM